MRLLVTRNSPVPMTASAPSVMNSVVWDLLDAGTQYIDSIAYSAYYASLGAVI